jgi:hypothetical protein
MDDDDPALPALMQVDLAKLPIWSGNIKKDGYSGLNESAMHKLQPDGHLNKPWQTLTMPCSDQHCYCMKH